MVNYCHSFLIVFTCLNTLIDPTAMLLFSVLNKLQFCIHLYVSYFTFLHCHILMTCVFFMFKHCRLKHYPVSSFLFLLIYFCL